MKRTTKAFLAGIGSLLDLMPVARSIQERQQCGSGFRMDRAKLAGDWQRLAGDFRRVTDRRAHERG